MATNPVTLAACATEASAIRIVALDPGPVRSALVEFDTGANRLRRARLAPNDELIVEVFRSLEADVLVVECTKAYTLPGGRNGRFMPQEVLDTCEWVGRFLQAAPCPTAKLDRRAVRLHLLGRANGTDAQIREALLERWGGRELAVGRKRAPGPLHGIKADLWAALAVAVTWRETRLAVDHAARAAGDEADA